MAQNSFIINCVLILKNWKNIKNSFITWALRQKFSSHTCELFSENFCFKWNLNFFTFSKILKFVHFLVLNSGSSITRLKFFLLSWENQKNFRLSNSHEEKFQTSIYIRHKQVWNFKPFSVRMCVVVDFELWIWYSVGPKTFLQSLTRLIPCMFINLKIFCLILFIYLIQSTKIVNFWINAHWGEIFFLFIYKQLHNHSQTSLSVFFCDSSITFGCFLINILIFSITLSWSSTFKIPIAWSVIFIKFGRISTISISWPVKWRESGAVIFKFGVFHTISKFVIHLTTKKNSERIFHRTHQRNSCNKWLRRQVSPLEMPYPHQIFKTLKQRQLTSEQKSNPLQLFDFEFSQKCSC